MVCLTTLIPLLLAAVSLPGLHAQISRPLQANMITHPTCSGTDLEMDGPGISVVRGVQGAPCTGYVEFDDFKICNDNSGYPTKEMAQRICYTLGSNMFRSPGFTSGSNAQIMLFDCDIYTEYGLDEPTEGDGSTVIAAWEGTSTPIGKHCPTPASNDFCFDQCYNVGTNILADGSKFEDTCEGTTADGPFWATTCSDIDECHNGVLAECTGPFPSSCTKKPACGEHTKCENAQGGWKCECELGYRAENVESPYEDGCEDIDECEEDEEDEDGEGICGYHAQCINKKGYYICVCLRPDLYNEEEHKCEKATCPAPPYPLPHAIPIIPYTNIIHSYGDKVTYKCEPGYRVLGHGLSQSLNPYYGSILTDSFEIKCSASGHWEPYPIPVCHPITCQDPGYYLHAVREGNLWEYGQKCTFTCETGFRPRERSYGDSYFELTCKDDGYWTSGTTCEDIDECDEHPGICGYAAKYCINTIGSYMCSCVSWYHKDPKDQSCDNYEAVGSLEPCHLMHSMGFCKQGDCTNNDGKATCNCFEGFEGDTCDRRKDDPALIIAIVALVLIGVLICLCCICCCCRHQLEHSGVHGHPVQAYPQVVKPMSCEPTYGLATRAVLPQNRIFGRRMY